MKRQCPHVTVTSLGAAGPGRPLARSVARAVRATLRAARHNTSRVAVFFIADAQMRLLNRRFRGRDRMASVLSFAEPPHFPRPDLRGRCRCLGEVYLACRYAQRRGEDLCYLAVHGTLHLLGYTHHGRRDRMAMERLERQALRTVRVLR